MRKFIVFIVALATMLSMSAVAFATETTPYDQAKDLASNYVSTYYDNYAEQTLDAPDDFYVKVDGAKEDYSFLKDGDLNLSIGSNGFIEGKFYQEKEDGLYIAFPVVLFNLPEPSNYADVTSIKSQNDKIVAVKDNGRNTFTVTHDSNKPAQTYVGFGVDGVQTGEIIITQRKYTGADGAEGTPGYGLMPADSESYTGGTDAGVALYPFGWTATGNVSETWDGVTMDYSVFSVTQGKVAAVTLKLKVADMEKLAEEVAGLEKTVQMKETELQITKEELGAAQEALNEIQGQLEDAISARDELQNQYNALVESSNGNNNELATVRAQLEAKEAEIDSIKEELNAQKDNVNTLASELNNAKSELTTAKAELEAAKKDKTDAETAKATAEAEKAEAEKANTELQDKYDTLVVKTSQVKNVKAKAGKKKATVTFKSLGEGYTYKVFKATKKNGKYKALNKTATGKTKVVAKNLKKGKTYYFKVKAYKTVGEKSVATKYSKVVKTKVK